MMFNGFEVSSWVSNGSKLCVPVCVRVGPWTDPLSGGFYLFQQHIVLYPVDIGFTSYLSRLGWVRIAEAVIIDTAYTKNTIGKERIRFCLEESGFLGRSQVMLVGLEIWNDGYNVSAGLQWLCT
jgi:hypothetical protein